MKKVLAYSALCIGILIAFLQQWILLAVFLTLLFTRYFSTQILLVIGVLIDGYFGSFASVPVFSLLALGWFIIAESLRDQVTVSRDTRV